MLNTLVSSGQNMNDWPAGTELMKEVMQKFLAPALDHYFKQTQVLVNGRADKEVFYDRRTGSISQRTGEAVRFRHCGKRNQF